jgi:hypothetical protein
MYGICKELQSEEGSKESIPTGTGWFSTRNESVEQAGDCEKTIDMQGGSCFFPERSNKKLYWRKGDLSGMRRDETVDFKKTDRYGEIMEYLLVIYAEKTESGANELVNQEVQT